MSGKPPLSRPLPPTALARRGRHRDLRLCAGFHGRAERRGANRALTAAGAEKVFRETASGATTDRLQLRRALDRLAAGDVLMVTELDRQARSTRDLLNTLAAITDRKAGFRSLGNAWADTTTSHGRPMVTMLGGLAGFERDLIRVRTGDGRVRAKARGKSIDRPFKMTVHQGQKALARRGSEELLTEIARSYNVSAATISRLGQVRYV
jgi:DNA invertase Pin-like site-specific DNA recombinase